MANQEKSAAELYREERKARIAKAAKKNQKKSHKVVLSKKAKAAIAVCVVIAIGLGIGGFAIGNSGILERGKVAFTVGDTEVTMAEYGYYYNSMFSRYFEYSRQYESHGAGMGAMYTGYDCTVAPDVQKYPQELEGYENPTWCDFFDYSAKQQIKYAKGCVAYAAENDIKLTDEDYAEIDTMIEETEATAKSGQTPYSLAAYLRTFYGKAMTVDMLRKVLEEQTIIQKVQEAKMDEYKATYTDEKIDEIYNKDLTAYGVVSLRNYVINAEKVTNEEDETSAVTKETMAAAKAKATAFAQKVSDDASFKNAAYESEKAAGNKDAENMKTDETLTLLTDQAYTSLSSTDADFLKWAFDKDTKVGETFIVESEDTGYTVYMMSEPVHHAPDYTETYDVRHILVKFPEEEEASEDAAEGEEAKEEEKKDEVKVEMLDTSAYDVTVDIDVDLESTGDKETYKKAQDILKEYLDGEKTEEAFAELAKKYSEDNAEDGGLYTDVPQGKMVAEFEGWSHAAGRKVGDVGIVESTYGYHIMYHVGSVVLTWSDVIKNDLAAEEYNEFADEVSTADSVKIENENADALLSVKEAVVKLAKQQARNIQSSANATY